MSTINSYHASRPSSSTQQQQHNQYQTTSPTSRSASATSLSSTQNLLFASDKNSANNNNNSVLFSTSTWEEQLPKQLICGGTRYILIELGEGNGGQVYVPSLALQRRPLPMSHTWRPRYDSERKATFFVNLNDRSKLWQLPDVQEQLSSAVEYPQQQLVTTAEIIEANTNNNSISRKSSSLQATPIPQNNNNNHNNASRNPTPFDDTLFLTQQITQLTAEEVGVRRKVSDRHRREYFELTEQFREDMNAMRKLQRVQLALIEQKLRDDIEKVMKNNVANMTRKAEDKIFAKRRIAELLSLETADRADIRFGYDHGLMAIREDEARGRLSAKLRTRQTAGQKYLHFERVAVDGAEEVQRDVLLQEESVERGKMFLNFSKMRLAGFLRLMRPEPGDPMWTPWSEEIRVENAFISSKDFGLFYTPPVGEVVHKAWYAQRHRQEDAVSEVLAAARVDAVALFGDFTLGLAELHRLFVKAILSSTSLVNANEEIMGNNNNHRSVSTASSSSAMFSTTGKSKDNQPPLPSSSNAFNFYSEFNINNIGPKSASSTFKFRWLDAQLAIDGEPMTSSFPSSFQKSKERQLIDVLKSEQDWRDRAQATARGIQKKRMDEEQNLLRQKPVMEKQRDLDNLQVQSHDTAMGRHVRRFPENNNYDHHSHHPQHSPENINNTNNRSNNQYSNPHLNVTTSTSSSSRTPKTLNQMYNQKSGGYYLDLQDEASIPFAPSNIRGQRNPSSSSLSERRNQNNNKKSTPFAQEIDDYYNNNNNYSSSPSADMAAERLELIQAIRRGQVLEDQNSNQRRNTNEGSVSLHDRVTNKLSGILGRNNNSPAAKSRLDGDADWSRFSNNHNDDDDGGLRWDVSSGNRGVIIIEEGSTAVFDPKGNLTKNYRNQSNNFNQHHQPFRIAPAFCIGTVGVSKGLFIWQVRVRISHYQKYAGNSPTFKVGMVSRNFGTAMEKAAQRNSVLSGWLMGDKNNDNNSGLLQQNNNNNNNNDEKLRKDYQEHYYNETKAMSYWYDEQGSLWTGRDAMKLTQIAKNFGPKLFSENPDQNGGTTITAILDLDKNFLQFYVDRRPTGVAFRFHNDNNDIKNNSSNVNNTFAKEPLFPAILFSCVGDEAMLMPPDTAVLDAFSLNDQ